MLEAALNKGNKPPVIQGRIEVVDLNMGTQPPTLTLLEIGDLSLDRFRGIMRLGYQGDAWIEVRCRVQANPLSHHPNPLHSSALPISTPLLASQPLLVPMTLRLSLLHLRAILILVVSASKGITLVFKNDPLQNVDVSSTFDSVEVIRGYLQQEIEGQLREMFREDLPGIIHRLSQRWFTGTGTGGKVETPYKDADPSSSYAKGGEEEDETAGAEHEHSPPSTAPVPVAHSTPRRRSSRTSARERRPSNALSESPTSYTVFPGIEHYDPTYGLRPEGLPTHSEYEAFGRLWGKIEEGKGRGLGSLMGDPTLLSPPPEYSSEPSPDEDAASPRSDIDEAEVDDDVDERQSLDMVELDQALQSASISGPSGLQSRSRSRATSIDIVEWETFPAVGGGVVTRPRVYHAQSRIRAPSEAGQAMPSPSGTATATGGSVTARAASSIGAGSSTVGSLRRHDFTVPQSPLLRQATAGSSSLRRVFNSSNLGGSVAATPSSSGLGPSNLRTDSKPNPAHGHYQQSARSMPPSRRASATNSSSAAKTSGSSWDTQHTHDTSRSATLSTMASSQLPSSKGYTTANPHHHPSMDDNNHRIPQHTQRYAPDRAPSLAMSVAPAARASGPGYITLPLNNSVSQLATLSHSAHTLSPYARGHEHIAVRSFPHLGKSVGPGAAGAGVAGIGSSSGTTSYTGSSGGYGYGSISDAMVGGGGYGHGHGGVHMKAAHRKRIYRLNSGSKVASTSAAAAAAATPTPAPVSQLTGGGRDEVDDDWAGGVGAAVGDGYRATAASAVGLGGGSLAGSGVRPNYLRRGDSRSSYGFPQLEKR